MDDPGLTGLSAVTVCAWVKFVKNARDHYFLCCSSSTNEIDIWCYTNEVIFSVKILGHGKIVYEFSQVADVTCALHALYNRFEVPLTRSILLTLWRE